MEQLKIVDWSLRCGRYEQLSVLKHMVCGSVSWCRCVPVSEATHMSDWCRNVTDGVKGVISILNCCRSGAEMMSSGGGHLNDLFDVSMVARRTSVAYVH